MNDTEPTFSMLTKPKGRLRGYTKLKNRILDGIIDNNPMSGNILGTNKTRQVRVFNGLLKEATHVAWYEDVSQTIVACLLYNDTDVCVDTIRVSAGVDARPFGKLSNEQWHALVQTALGAVEDTFDVHELLFICSMPGHGYGKRLLTTAIARLDVHSPTVLVALQAFHAEIDTNGEEARKYDTYDIVSKSFYRKGGWTTLRVDAFGNAAQDGEELCAVIGNIWERVWVRRLTNNRSQ